MEKRELLLILDRVVELGGVDVPSMESYISSLENDKYLKEFGFTFEKLSEEIQKLEN